MDEEDWREIVRIIQDELREIGHSDIADLSHYEVREDFERFLPDSRYLVKEMLDALHRNMSVRSSTTVRQSIDQLGRLIDDGVKRTEAFVWLDRERSAVEGRGRKERLGGNEEIPKAVEDLQQLIGQLAEIGSGRDIE